MDSRIRELEQLTADALSRLPEMDYEALEQWILQRETIVQQLIQGPISEADKLRYGARVRAVMDQDRRIVQRMHELKDEAAGHLGKFGAARKQRGGYEHLAHADAHFFDAKK